MSNKASNYLFQLIKSLDVPERRYFKVYTAKHAADEAGNYHVLFDAIYLMEEYDEDLLIEELGDSPMAKRFSIAKNRLYNVILKTLDAFHSGRSIETQVKRQIHSVEILYRKSLYDQAKRFLHSARKSAEKNELITSLIEIGKWEKRLIARENYESVKVSDLEKMKQRDKELMKKLSDYHELWYTKSNVISKLYKKGKTRSAEEDLSFDNIIAELDQGKNSSTVENNYLKNHILSAHYFAKGHYEKCYPILLKNISLIEDNSFQFEQDPDTYFSVLTNATYVAAQMSLFDEAMSFLKKVQNLPEKLGERMTEDLEIRIFSISKSLELTLYALSGQFEKGRKVLPEVEEALVLYEHKMSAVRKAQFYFSISSICFGAQQYDECLKWLNQLLNNIGINDTQDIHCFAQMFYLIVHLELGNKSLIPHALRSTKRYLETRNRKYKFENILLDFVTNNLKNQGTEEPEILHKNLLKALTKLQKHPYERVVFEYFDFLSWARSKVEGRPFAELVKESGSQLAT